jgi:hypothetical protein
MTTYVDEKGRRIEQFTQYLRLMGLRRHKVVKGDCFVIFDESAPEDVGDLHIKESAAIKIDCSANGGSASGRNDPVESSLADWMPGESFRYVQFAFMRDCFYLELPNNTVFPNEVELILQQRLGFYYAKNRPDLRWTRANWKDIVKWDPLQKVYLYRDEESAAEDMAFILFQVWKFPVDWRWYIKAAAFHTGRRFEDGKWID